jgi:hypothetical protein
MNEQTKEGKQFVHPSQPDLMKLYVNGIVAGQTPTDVYLVGILNGAPSFIMNMPYSTLKHLHNIVGTLIKDFEAATGKEIDLPRVTHDKLRAFKEKK